MKDARALVSTTCELIDIVSEIHNGIHTNSNEALDNIGKIIDTIDSNLSELNQPEMINQYDPNDREDFRRCLEELKASVDNHRKFVQHTSDARWIERMGVM